MTDPIKGRGLGATVWLEIQSAPKSPELLFERLKLPVRKITGVKVSGSVAKRNREFCHNDATCYSPEIVALNQYVKEGHTGVWSEGLSLQLVADAIDRYFSRQLQGYFDIDEVSGIDLELAKLKDLYAKFNRAAVAVEMGFASASDYPIEELRNAARHIFIKSAQDMGKEAALDIYRSAAVKIEAAFGIYLDGLSKINISRAERGDASKSYIARLEGSIVAERAVIESGKIPCGILHDCKSGSVSGIKTRASHWVATKLTVSPEELLVAYDLALSKIRSDKSEVINSIVARENTGDKTDPWNKFCNAYTTDFASAVVGECDIDYLIEVCSKVLPRWDLLLIDKDSKRLRFVEVKLNDGFTEYQLRRLPVDIENGFLPELCVISVSQ